MFLPHARSRFTFASAKHLLGSDKLAANAHGEKV
jgi:hypothetical protein